MKNTIAITEFDLPPGYGAGNAFHTGLWWCDLQYRIPVRIARISCDTFEGHFGRGCFNGMSADDRANFILLLAVANGHPLK